MERERKIVPSRDTICRNLPLARAREVGAKLRELLLLLASDRRTSCIMQPLLSRTHAYARNKQSSVHSNFLLVFGTFYGTAYSDLPDIVSIRSLRKIPRRIARQITVTVSLATVKKRPFSFSFSFFSIYEGGNIAAMEVPWLNFYRVLHGI